jgi:predicted nucleic acid-binding protein
VLVYGAAGRLDERRKHLIARDIISAGEFAVSTQVLGEFYAVMRHPQAERLSIRDAQTWLQKLEVFCMTSIDYSVVHAASFIKERYKIQFWDAALVAAAERLKISTLLTEDLNHGQKYGSVTAINPFEVK